MRANSRRPPGRRRRCARRVASRLFFRGMHLITPDRTLSTTDTHTPAVRPPPPPRHLSRSDDTAPDHRVGLTIRPLSGGSRSWLQPSGGELQLALTARRSHPSLIAQPTTPGLEVRRCRRRVDRACGAPRPHAAISALVAHLRPPADRTGGRWLPAAGALLLSPRSFLNSLTIATSGATASNSPPQAAKRNFRQFLRLRNRLAGAAVSYRNWLTSSEGAVSNAQHLTGRMTLGYVECVECARSPARPAARQAKLGCNCACSVWRPRGARVVCQCLEYRH